MEVDDRLPTKNPTLCVLTLTSHRQSPGNTSPRQADVPRPVPAAAVITHSAGDDFIRRTFRAGRPPLAWNWNTF
jgi:hypothetical protein